MSPDKRHAWESPYPMVQLPVNTSKRLDMLVSQANVDYVALVAYLLVLTQAGSGSSRNQKN